MDNIMQMLKEQSMQQQPASPTPTEKSQIVVNYNFPSPAPIFRFNTVKKGEAEYKRLCRAWVFYMNEVEYFGAPKRAGKPFPERFIEVKGDMFIGTIDIATIASINFVDFNKRSKFIPEQY